MFWETNLVEKLINKLTSILSANPKLIEIEKKIIQKIEINLPLSKQQQLKPLWYNERLNLAINKRFEEISPVNMELVPSLECNLNCPPCTYRKWKAQTINNKGRRIMSYQDMILALDRLEAGGVKGVTITGGGEPFTNPWLMEGLKYASEKQFKTGLFTNGTLLTPKQIETLATLDLSFVRVSFNSGESTNYLKFHGTGDPETFKNVKENIKLLGQALYHSEISYGIATIINEVNIDYLPAIASYLRELLEKETKFKLNYFTIRPVVNYGQMNLDLTKQITPLIAKRAIENFKKVKEILKDFPLSLKIADDYFLATGKATEKMERGYQKCIGHSWCGSVAYDGGVYLCSERNGDPNYLMGNILTTSLKDIWKSEQRYRVLENISNCPPVCKIHRFNQLLHQICNISVMDAREVEELEGFLDLLRAEGEPEKLEFFSF